MNASTDRTLLMDRSVSGRRAVRMPTLGVPETKLPPDEMLRDQDDLRLPEIDQLEVIRYFTMLSRLNFSIDTNFYPLGSCTMKYNPKLNDQAAGLPGFSDVHPLQTDSTVQGALTLMYELQGWLGEVSGLPGVALSPLAGCAGRVRRPVNRPRRARSIGRNPTQCGADTRLGPRH